MKKLFISQPMRGKTAEEIMKERKRMIARAGEIVCDEIEVLDTYYQDFDGNRVSFLARSISDLSKADVAIFAPGWEDFSGCRCEHAVCEEYGIAHIHDTPVDMTQDREAEILEGAISHFGSDHQINKAIEELGELIVELSRHLNGADNDEEIRGELADAFVMLNQMELIFGDVTEIEIAKLERLEGMIKNASL